MIPYQERVFDIIDSFSIFNGSVLEFAKRIFIDSDVYNMYPSNAALCCINVANEYLYDRKLKEYWSEVLLVLHKANFRKRKPTLGRKLYQNIIKNSDKFRVDLEKNKKAVEVMFSGSKISFKES